MDDERWRSDPLEYIRREENNTDITQNSNDYKNVALDIIKYIC